MSNSVAIQNKPSTLTNSEKVNLRAKEMLARLLASENLTIVHKNVPSASFDMKKRLLVLPKLENMSNTMYTGFIGHEVGHALFTPGDYNTAVNSLASSHSRDKKEVHTIFNAVEDARIEKLMKRRFNGLTPVFSSFYKELSETHPQFKEVIETIEHDKSKQSFVDRLNGEFKVGGHYNFHFTPEERKIVDMVRDAESPEDVEEAVRTVLQYIDAPPPQGGGGGGGGQNNDSDQDQDDNQDQQESQGGGGGGQSGKQDKKQDNKPDKGQNDKQDKNDQKDDKKNDKSSGGSDKQDEKEDQSQGGGGNSEENEDEEEKEDNSSGSGDSEDGEDEEQSQNQSQPQQEEEDDKPQPAKPQPAQAQDGQGQELPSNFKSGSLQDALNAAQQKEIDIGNKGANVETCYIPEFDLSKVIITHDNAYTGVKANANSISAYNAFVKANAKGIMHMVQEFERRKAADEHRRSRTARSGMLDTQRLAKYKMTDDIFKRVETVKEGKNHGLVMFIDWSGSMAGDRAIGAVKQALILSEFCRKAGIKFDIYTFVSRNSTNNLTKTPKMLDYRVESFSLVNVLSYKMKPRAYRESSAKLLAIANRDDSYSSSYSHWNMGGTPLNSSIMAAFNIIPAFQKETGVNKVHAAFLTDGASDYLSTIVGENGYARNLELQNGGVLYTHHRPTGVRNRTLINTGSNSYYGGANAIQTRATLELLQQSLGVNALGFFITESVSPSEMRNCQKKNIDELKEQGYTILEDEGYRQLYIMSKNMMKGDVSKSDNAIKDMSNNRKSKFLLTEIVKQLA